MSVLCLNGCSDVDSGVDIVHSPCNCLSVSSLSDSGGVILVYPPSNCLPVLSLCGFQRYGLSTSNEFLNVNFVIELFQRCSLSTSNEQLFVSFSQ